MLRCYFFDTPANVLLIMLQRIPGISTKRRQYQTHHQIMRNFILLLLSALASLPAQSQPGQTLYSLKDTKQLKQLNVAVQAEA